MSESEFSGRKRESVRGRGPSLFQKNIFSNTARNHNTSSTAPHIAEECQCFPLLRTSPVNPFLGNDVIWCFKLLLI